MGDDRNGAGAGDVDASWTPASRASMRKVAERAGVAISSVSRVLSGHPDVSPAMRQRVLAAVGELEYEPDFLAQSLRRGQTLSVGFVLSDISNPLLADIVLGAEATLRSGGYSLLLMNSENDPALDVSSIRFFQTRRVDGMLLSIVSESDGSMLEVLGQVKVPVVLVDREVPGEIRASSVHNDHASGHDRGRAPPPRPRASAHRADRRLAGTLPGRAREAGLREAIEADRRPRDGPARLVLARSRRRGHAHAARRPPPSAIICGSNQVLVGCLRVLHAEGIASTRRVARDLRRIPRRAAPAAHRLDRPGHGGPGPAAADLLLRRLRDGAEPETVVLPTTFTPTASCAPA